MRQQKNVFGHKIQIMPAPTPAAILVGVTVVVNALLWTSYAVTRPDATDFGNAPSSMHTYMLVMAALAYAANLASLGLLAADARTSAADLYALSQWTAPYYGLQLAFIPSVRAAVRGDASRGWTRLLLVACVVPIVEIALLAWRSDASSTTLRILCVFVVLHVALNDALLYGYSF